MDILWIFSTFLAIFIGTSEHLCTEAKEVNNIKTESDNNREQMITPKLQAPPHDKMSWTRIQKKGSERPAHVLDRSGSESFHNYSESDLATRQIRHKNTYQDRIPGKRIHKRRRGRSASIKDGATLESLLADMAWQAVEQHLYGCHFTLMTDNIQHPIVSYVIEYSKMASAPLVLVDVSKYSDPDTEDLLAGLYNSLWGVPNTVCWTVLIDLTSGDDTSVLDFLDNHNMYRFPLAWVVIIGSRFKAESTLLHFTFRNNLQPLYLGLGKSTIKSLGKREFPKRNITENVLTGIYKDFLPAEDKASRDVVLVYSKCLYCNQGEPMVKLVFGWPIGTELKSPLNPFPDQHNNTQGHFFRLVSMPSFPFNAQMLDSDEVASTVTLEDCLDKRMLDTMSAHLNFTFEVRTPWDGNWGVPTETGNYTGMLGTIQHNKADFTTIMAPISARLIIVDPARAYEGDAWSVVALKPDLIPQYFIIIMPFTVDVWLYLLLTVLVWGLFFWLTQKLWSLYSGGRPMSLNWGIFHSWAIILEDPPPKPPKNSSARILLGFWLMVCLITTTGFRAALVAHLGVQAKTKPIDNFKDLVERRGFKWGMEARYLTGVSLIYFKTTTDPDAKYLFKSIEYLKDYQTAFEKIIQGRYAMITFEGLAHMLIRSYYTDNVGNTPYYVSKQGYSIAPYFGWGFRKGAPFRPRFDMIMNRFHDSGIMTHWRNEVMDLRVKRNRREIAEKEGKVGITTYKLASDNREIKLRVIHLLGVFLVFFLGCGLSVIALFVEILVKKI